MKAVGVIRLGFQFMVGLSYVKRQISKCWLKFFFMVGMFVIHSLMYNMSWVHIADFNKTSKNVTTMILSEMSGALVNRRAYMKKCTCSQNMLICLLNLRLKTNWETDTRQQAIMSLSSCLPYDILKFIF